MNTLFRLRQELLSFQWADISYDRYQVIAGADIAVLHINADAHDLPL